MSVFKPEPPAAPKPRPSEKVKVGDYVLATKFNDGDPCDHFCVGFVSGFTSHPPGDQRYLVVDNSGKQNRLNGFRRAELITEEEGHKLCAMMPEIGDRNGKSLWWHLDTIRGEPNPFDPCESDEDMLRRVVEEVYNAMKATPGDKSVARGQVLEWAGKLKRALNPSA